MTKDHLSYLDPELLFANNTIFQYKKMIHAYEILTCSVISLFEEDVDEYGGCLEIKHVMKFFIRLSL